MKQKKCREHISIHTKKHYILNLTGLSYSFPVLGLIAILMSLPAMIYGCSSPDMGVQSETDTPIRLMQTSNDLLSKADHIDVLIFNDDKLKRLDTYQRFELPSCSTVKASSSAGNKIMTVLVNSKKDKYEWAEINTLFGLSDLCVNLEDETIESPAMSGQCSIQAGYPVNIIVQKVASEIVIQSLSCDFSGRPYSGETLKNVKIYLTNVNSEVPMVAKERYLPQRIINNGRLNPDDLKSFRCPSLIYQNLESEIGDSVIKPDIRLRCYPNESEEESPGSPFTRLVIEGEINGTTYYWPININRNADGNGIGRNSRYIYDIKITRTGHTDPDIPIQIEDAKIIMKIQSWEDMEEYGVRF